MSAENALILSSQAISKNAFIDFFEGLGCRWHSGHKNEAIVLDDFTQVGVCLMDENYIDMFDGDDLKEFEVALGGAPKTFFEVNRSKADDPDDLYLVVARKMAKIWPVAVCDPTEKMLPYSDLVGSPE